jgi:molybdopterin/thiamine biosynthesis adenylyltransferase/rhodanese-related sulfurtransferase
MSNQFQALLNETKKQISEISIEETRRIIQNNSHVVILDVREKEETAGGFIEGALFIPRGLLEMRAEDLLLEKDATVVVYCAKGIRSVFAAKTLKDMGYYNTFSMAKGFEGWKAAGYEVATSIGLTQDQFVRYSRQILLKDIGEKGQSLLMKAKVLLVGAGGLGSPAALYLGGAGVGTLGIIDSDRVDLSNLHRQILHGSSDVGRPKTESAREAIHRINPEVNVVTYQERLTPKNAINLFQDYDIIMDGSDNFPTKYLINDACFFAGKPNIYGGVFQFEGQASVFFSKGGGPCLRCLFPEPPPPGLVPS